MWVFFMTILTGCNDDPKPKPETVPVEDTVSIHVVDSDELNGYFDSLYDRGHFNGNGLFFHNDSMVVISKGRRVLGDTQELRTTDVFQLASLSKPITALGVLRLVEKGEVALDIPLVRYLFDFPDDRITLRSLLNHTSGMGNYLYVTDSLWNNPDSFMSNDDMYDMLRCEQVPKYHPPFTRFDYCNTNYAVLPVLVERVTGLTFETFMRQEVFDPIGMDSTHYLDPWTRPTDDYPVLGHYPNGDPKRPFYLDGVIGDKSLFSSVEDLFKLYQEIQDPSLWSEDLLSEAMQPSVRSGSGQFYGLGWRIRPMEQDTLIFHNGWWRGFRSYFWMSSSEKKVAIILTNSIRGGYLEQNRIWSLF